MSTTLLPPTPRDFDIHRMSLIMHFSTWRIAAKHGISQTRVRQVIQRVSQWLAATIRVRTGVEKEKEIELAQHLAAEQMRTQIEELQNFWDGSSDPKYLRQQTRIIAALARLGTVPGTIDALAADATTGPLDPNEPQQPWSEDDPWANQVQGPRSKVQSPSAGAGTSSTLDLGLGTLDPTAPLPGDFSASSGANAAAAPAACNASAPTVAAATTSNRERRENENTLEGLKIMEGRLLKLIDGTSPADSDRLASLNNTLAEVRRSKAAYELRLSPNVPGAEIRVESGSPQKREQEETEVTENSKC